MSTLLPLLLLGFRSALAFAPSDEVLIGAEPDRVYRFHQERQSALRHAAAWQSFLHGDGAG